MGLSYILDLFLPRRCIICDNRLNSKEHCLCTGCLASLPRLDISSFGENIILRRFWDKASVHSGSCLMPYVKDSVQHRIFEQLKYRGRPDVGNTLGMFFGSTFLKSGFFEGIDLIIPIPLSRKRMHKRGYNQSEKIAQGISKATGIPVNTKVLRRIKDNPSQTRLTAAERQENAANIFAVHNASQVEGKHILLIDDIITTGATMTSAILALQEAAPSITISVGSLALTQE